MYKLVPLRFESLLIQSASPLFRDIRLFPSAVKSFYIDIVNIFSIFSQIPRVLDAPIRGEIMPHAQVCPMTANAGACARLRAGERSVHEYLRRLTRGSTEQPLLHQPGRDNSVGAAPPRDCPTIRKPPAENIHRAVHEWRENTGGEHIRSTLRERSNPSLLGQVCCGRGRLPVWAVGILSVLRFIVRCSPFFSKTGP